MVKNGDDASGTRSSAAPASCNSARASSTSPSASARTAAKWRVPTSDRRLRPRLRQCRRRTSLRARPVVGHQHEDRLLIEGDGHRVVAEALRGLGDGVGHARHRLEVAATKVQHRLGEQGACPQRRNLRAPMEGTGEPAQGFGQLSPRAAGIATCWRRAAGPGTAARRTRWRTRRAGCPSRRRTTAEVRGRRAHRGRDRDAPPPARTRPDGARRMPAAHRHHGAEPRRIAAPPRACGSGRPRPSSPPSPGTCRRDD